ncbi:hypothetical protein BGW80DRAFT_1461020 [Lactifluus volemus]|nr:hypothetical protein BGW80DRAFT_1464076 [Lactifluus volemus]KAH9970779.1 hypothetical protein BGW80DRAFT_1461020 [Lactifluus volemus]
MTRRKNAHTHPGHVVLELQKKRRTPQQVAEEKMLEKAEAAAAAESAAATQHANVRRVAELEDIVERDSRAKQKHSDRPDLRPSHGQTAQKFTSEVAYAAQLNEVEPIDEQYDISSSLDSRKNAGFEVYGDEISTVSPATFIDAEESIIDVSSSEGKNSTASQGNGDDMGVYEDDGGDEEDRGDVNDGNKNKDKANLRSETVNARPSPRPKPRAIYRRISEGRDEPSSLPVTRTPSPPPPTQPRNPVKRKLKPQSAGTASDQFKRAKVVAEPSGLLFDWRKRVKINSAPQLSQTWMRPTDTPERRDSRAATLDLELDISGSTAVTSDFHNEEYEDVLKHRRSRLDQTSRAAQSGAALSGTVGARATAQMGIVLARDTSATESDGKLEGSKCPRRTRPTMSDLPFPPAESNKNMEKWRKTFVPALLSWAGRQIDPFGTNSMIQEPAEDIWFSTFPDVALDDTKLGIVMAVVENTLNNWRSDMGKSGYRAVADMWLEDPVTFGDAEACAEYVDIALDKLRFVYRDPDAKSARGAFCSDLIVKVYATHIRKLQLKLQELEDPPMHFGALALATAAVERGLSAFMTDEDDTNSLTSPSDPLTSQGSNGKGTSHPVSGFTDNPWGAKTRKWVESTERLNRSQWEKVTHYAYAFIPAVELRVKEAFDKGNSSKRVADPRSCIELDCLSRFNSVRQWLGNLEWTILVEQFDLLVY